MLFRSCPHRRYYRVSSRCCLYTPVCNIAFVFDIYSFYVLIADIQEACLLTMLRVSANCETIPEETLSVVRKVQENAGRHIKRVSASRTPYLWPSVLTYFQALRTVPDHPSGQSSSCTSGRRVQVHSPCHFVSSVIWLLTDRCSAPRNSFGP